MKKFIITICTIFIAGIARADTMNLNWIVDDSVYDTTACTIGGDVILPTAPTKRGYTFKGWAIYTPIEYIESTGTQYIDTNVTQCGTGTTVKVRYGLDVSQNRWHSVYGAETDFAFTTSFQQQQNSYQYYGWSDVSAVVDANIHTVKQVSEKFYIDDVFVYSRPERAFSSNKKMLMFSRAASTPQYNLIGKIYYFKLWKNDVLVRDMIPVLDPDGVACMYDKVSKTFFYNAGTGNFIAGPVITE